MFGKSKMVSRRDGEGTARVQLHRVKREAWPVVSRDHHAAYISLDECIANLEWRQGKVMMRGERGSDNTNREEKSCPIISEVRVRHNLSYSRRLRRWLNR